MLHGGYCVLQFEGLSLLSPDVLLAIVAEKFHLGFIRPKDSPPEASIFVLVLSCIFQPDFAVVFLKEGLPSCSAAS